MAKLVIPIAPNKFNDFMERIVKYIDDHKLIWNHILDDRVITLRKAYYYFLESFLSYKNIPMQANWAVVKKARADATSELRTFIKQFLRYPPVTDADRTAMGIPNHDNIRTSHFIVTESVELEFVLCKVSELMVKFWVKGSSRKAKPNGYKGAVIAWDILDKTPLDPEELKNRSVASATPVTIHFKGADRGKTVYISAAWQNGRGIIGSFCEIQSTVVP